MYLRQAILHVPGHSIMPYWTHNAYETTYNRFINIQLILSLFHHLVLPSEEVCILSAAGTAAILNPRYMREGCLDIGSSDHRWI